MKFLCPACERLADISTFRVDGGALLLRCDRCGVESRATGEAQAASEAPRAAAAPEPVAPVRELGPAKPVEAIAAVKEPEAPAKPPEGSAKVVALRPLAVVPPPPAGPGQNEAEWLGVPEGCCPKCVAPRKPNARACPQCGLIFENFRPEEHTPSATLLASWTQLTLAWDDPQAHERFVKDALLRQEVVPAGRLYRIRLARVPEDGMASHGRDLMLKLAAGSTPLAPPRDKVPRAARTVRVIAVVLVVAVSLGLLIGMLGRLMSGGLP